MTTKTVEHSSPLAVAIAAEKAALNEAANIRQKLNVTEAARATALDAIKKWETDWPNLVGRPNRPAFEGPDGLAVDMEGNPLMVKDGPFERRLNGHDIASGPPPSEQAIEELIEALAAAEADVAAKTVEVVKARKTHKPAKSGYVLVRGSKTISGLPYTAGDEVDVSDLPWVKLDRLIRVGILRHI